MTHAEGDDRLLRTGEVADLAGVDPSTIARWTKAGHLRVHHRTFGGDARYRRADVMHALAAAQAEAFEREHPPERPTDPSLTTELLGRPE